MAKILEVGFTSSGTVQRYTVGSNNITLVSGRYTYLDPLFGFTIRPGINMTNLGTSTNTDWGSNSIFKFSDTSRAKKTIVLWLRPSDGTNPFAVTEFYREVTTSGGQGWRVQSDGRVTYSINGVTTDVQAAGSWAVSTWKMYAAVMDRTTVKTRLYLNGNFLTQLSGVASGTTSNNPRYQHIVGSNWGLMQIYDHAASDAEMLNLYNTGLIESRTQVPFATMSGVVFDSNTIPISGASVFVYNYLRNDLDSLSITTSGGNYVAYFSDIGQYSLSATKSGVEGGRAFPVTVTSGGITVHDGS